MSMTKVPKVRRRKMKYGVTYYLDFYIDGQRKQTTVGPNKEHAKRMAAKVFHDHQNNAAGVQQLQKAPTLQGMVDRFFQTKDGHIGVGSLKRYKIYAAHFLTFFSQQFKRVKQIDQVTHLQLEEHFADLRRVGKKPRTINGHIYFTSALFKLAVEDEFIAKNPASRIKKLPERQDLRIQYWSKDEVLRILEAFPEVWRDKFEFYYNTGLRKSELMNLQWSDVILDTNPPCIMVVAEDDRGTKTNKRHSIPLNKKAVAIIERQPRQKKHSFVFSGAHGAPLYRDEVYNRLISVLTKLGLKGNVHQWRHTFASHLVMKGVGIETVSKLLGHTTLGMTMKYAHLAPDHLKAAVDLLEDD